MSDYFPKDIILQILHKLPMKSLVRCTCVCKTWHSLITNPSFISNHLTLTISSNTHLLLFRLCSEESEEYSLHFDNNQELSPYMVLDFPLQSWRSYFHVIGSFNGIICLVAELSSHNYTFILWNPLIQKSLTLHKPNVFYEDFIGFGFDSKTNDYKVLRVVHRVFNEQEEVEGEKPFMEVELYSLNTNSWKTITCVAPNYEFNMGHIQAFVNGVVHSIASQYMGHLGHRNVVLGFDLGDEVLSEVKLPESLANAIPWDMYVRKYGDSSIAVIANEYGVPFKCHIWVMKEYGVVESWTKLFSFREPGGRRGMWAVLGFRKSGEVLMQTYDGKIVSYDPQNQGVKDLGLRNQEWAAFVDGYVESLVLLDNANAVSDANAASNNTSDDGSIASDDEMDASDALSD